TSQATVTRTTVQEPKPEVWVSRGSVAPNGCTTVCNYVKLRMSDNFPSGTWAVQCFDDGQPFDGTSPTNYQLNAGTSRELYCWRGDYPGRPGIVTVKITNFNGTVHSVDW